MLKEATESSSFARYITQERVKELISYNPLTGEFNWLVLQGNRTEDIGWIDISTNYLHIRLDRIRYKAHQLAWLYMTGEFEELLDHKDTDRLNNKWDNLRKSTWSQNTMNSSLRSDNALGIKGVCYRGGAKPRYIAQIYKMGINYNRSFSIGKYGRAEALRLATEWSRSKREEIHGEFANHG